MTARIVVTLGLLVSALAIPRPVFASDESSTEVVEDAAVVEAQPEPVVVSPRVACIVKHESNWNPLAVNPRSGASGYGQFLHSTWMTTPQGRAGLSVFDGAANLRAIQWMIDVGRAREFQVVQVFGC